MTRASDGTVDVAVVGLGFGEDFLPLYQAHPAVGRVAIVDPSDARRDQVGERHGIADRYADLDEVLATDEWDAVHVLAPVSFHADYSVRVLESGRHCACAVPMATELDDLRRIVAAQQASGRVYMMMETSVYGREFRVVQEAFRSGAAGPLTYYRGAHLQNLDGYPSYWLGYPPMKYVTHALSPLLRLTGSRVARVSCLGSGRLTPERVGDYDNPFPVETGIFRLADSDVVGDVTMSFFQTARPYAEGFWAYGEDQGFEWPEVEGEPMARHDLLPLTTDEPETGLRGRRSRTTRVDAHAESAAIPHALPESLVRFTEDFDLVLADGTTERRRAEHGGSHPFLVHDFLTAVVEGGTPSVDAVTAADWTAPGICAHESALRDGEPVDVPTFD